MAISRSGQTVLGNALSALLLSAALVACRGASSSQKTPAPPTGTASPHATTTSVTAPTPTPAPGFFAVRFADTQTGWATGTQGIFATSDGGAHWRLQYATQPQQRLAQIDVVDKTTSFLLSADGLLTTGDGGLHWLALPALPSPLRQIDFVNHFEGWAVTAFAPAPDHQYGDLLHTLDGGITWTTVLPSANAICFDGPVGWVADLTHTIRTDDGGATWLPVFTNPINGPPSDTNERDRVWSPHIECKGRTGAWLLLTGGVAAFHLGYVIFRTSDAGANWTPVLQGGFQRDFGVKGGDAQPGPISLVDENNAFAAGGCTPCNPPYTVSVRATHDGGATWEKAVKVTDNAGPSSLQFVDRDRGWLAAGNGIFATVDGGQTWTRQLP